MTVGQPVFSGEGRRYRRVWEPARRGRDEALAWDMIDVDVSIPGLLTVIFRALPSRDRVSAHRRIYDKRCEGAILARLGPRRCAVRALGPRSLSSRRDRRENIYGILRDHGYPGGGTRFFVACSNAYASPMIFGSAHLPERICTPNGGGFGSKCPGNG